MRYGSLAMTELEHDHQLCAYHFDLPPELIAQRPVSPRDHSRLMVAGRQGLAQDARFYELAEHLPAGCLLVVNESRVYPARLRARKASGGSAEIFVLSLVPDQNGAYQCLLRSNSKKRLDDVWQIEGSEARARLKASHDDGTFQMLFEGASIDSIIQSAGQIPIPPYIRAGQSDAQDLQDYQTLFAKEMGSVAAPTAGLHFTPHVLELLRAKNIQLVSVSLHVGAGTFMPVKTADIRQHHMHTERLHIAPEVGTVLMSAWQSARPVVAVGTTALRTLESLYPRAMQGEHVWGTWQETNIFLHPGKCIQSIQGLITNFHLPESSLLMLTSALMGRERMLQLYRDAVEKKYRFFSYGDAMLLWP